MCVCLTRIDLGKKSAHGAQWKMIFLTHVRIAARQGKYEKDMSGI